MPVSIEFKNFRFAKAKYLEPKEIFLEPYAEASEFIEKANKLITEIARVGWELPDIQVKLTYRGKGTNIYKVCDEVSFNVEEKEQNRNIKIEYEYTYKKHNKNGKGIFGCSFSLDGKKYNLSPDGSGDWRNRGVWNSACGYLEQILRRLSVLESAPGYNDINPEGDANLRRICTSEQIPVPEGFPILYSWVEPNDAACALQTWKNEYDEDYSAELDYKLAGDGWRFCVTDDGLKWEELPEHANDGFSYASADHNKIATGLVMGATRECLPIEVRLKNLNDIFVYDRAPYTEGKKQAYLEAELTGSKKWKPGELAEIMRGSMRTFVPAAQYQGEYKDPVYCIGRQLDETEARAMNGSVSVRQKNDRVAAELKDYVTDTIVTLFEGDAVLSNMITAVSVARETARVLEKEAAIDPEVAETIDNHRRRLTKERDAERVTTTPSM